MGPYWHFGISDGADGVIHNSKKLRKVANETLAQFAEGREIHRDSLTSSDPLMAFERAKKYLGLPYNLLEENCEHFVRMVHGHIKESPQVQRYLIMAIGAGLALKSETPQIQIAGGAAAVAALLTDSSKSPVENALLAGLIALGISALASRL